MATLRPPSTSPSPSPGPGNGRTPSARASMGPSNRLASIGNPNALSPASPRPGTYGVGNRPTSEVLASAGMGGMFQTPEAEAIDQWFENLQNYELILEDMAKASMDANFKDELSAIEQWFRVLSEAERTAALYSLLQHSTQVQIRFFITVLQQMARSDPMTALLSPSVGGSMQAQMEAKLTSMGLKSPGVNSPSGRNFSPNQRQSLVVENPSNNFLSPDSALVSPGGPSNGSDAAATLAHQRARLKANAAHRISAPGTLTAAVEANRSSMWQQGASNLGQVDEGSATPEEGGRGSPAPASQNLNSARPKSTDFAGAIRNLRGPSSDDNQSNNSVLDMLSPMVGGNWASQVNTPLNPMFSNQEPGGQTLDAVTSRLASWNISNSSGGKVQLDDPKKYRRASKTGTSGGDSAGIYDDNGNLISTNGSQPGTGPRSRNVSTTSNAAAGMQNQWARSPSVFSNASSNRFGGDDVSSAASQLANMPGFNLNAAAAANGGLASPIPGLGMPNFGGAMGQMNMNMLMNGMNGMLDPNVQAQLLAAQIAAANGVLNPAAFLGMPGAGGGGNFGGMRSNTRGGGGRSPSGGSRGTSNAGGSGGGKDKGEKPEDEVDPKVLEDIPTWFRSLRLHKYTPNFQGMHWRDIVMMDEPALEAKGVAVVGARRKMLKTFELVRAKMGIEMASPPAIPA